MQELRQDILDAFQAVSLIIVFVTVMFGIRYPTIIENLKMEIPSPPLARRRTKLKVLHSLLINCVLQLLLIGGSLYLCLPLTIRIIKEYSFKLWNFEFLPTSFILVFVWISFIFCWCLILTIEMIIKHRKG